MYGLINDPLFFIVAWIISIVLTAIIFRSFFNVSTNTWYMRKQMQILQKIAEKHGVTNDEMSDIVSSK